MLEYLNYVQSKLPPGVTPSLGPDATGVGWVYEYVVQDPTGRHDLAQLRSIQDWYIRYQLQKVPGVSEVASVGGFVKQYQVVVNPNTLASYGIPLSKIKEAIMRSNNDVGGRVVEHSETEYMVRGLGYIKGIKDIENIVVGVDKQGTPVLVKDVALVRLGPEMRRGLTEANGEGEVVGGIVIARFRANARAVIDSIKEKLQELKVGLPPGVEIVPAYDRSNLIDRAVTNLKEKLLEEMVVVALVCIVFLLHFRSSLVAIVTLPLGVLIALAIMYEFNISANIMSLGGIALAIGVMVDAAVIMIENAHKHIEHAPPDAPRSPLILEAAKEVGPSLFFSLLVITVSFLPIFALPAESGRLFKPLAYTKTFSMAAASLLAITVVPVMMLAFLRGKIPEESRNPLNRLTMRLYHPLLEGVLKVPWVAIVLALILVGITIIPLSKLGSEFMPPINEGDLLYMPTTMPGQVADLKIHQGPDMIRSENARRSTWLYVDVRNIDVGGYIKKAKAVLADRLKLPPGYNYIWSGQFEYMERARQKLEVIIPITLAIIIFILYINTTSVAKVFIVLLAVPFFPGGGHLAPLSPGLSFEPGRGGGPHRPGRPERRNRDSDAPLPRHRLSPPPAGMDAVTIRTRKTQSSTAR